MKLTAADEKKIAALVKKAVSCPTPARARGATEADARTRTGDPFIIE
jgi:hypothetical protein